MIRINAQGHVLSKTSYYVGTKWGKAVRGWSKYGGQMFGYGRVHEDDGNWFCQVCGCEQPRGIPEYMMQIVHGRPEYARICSVCKHTQLALKMNNYYRLVHIIRISL